MEDNFDTKQFRILSIDGGGIYGSWPSGSSSATCMDHIGAGVQHDDSRKAIDEAVTFITGSHWTDKE